MHKDRVHHRVHVVRADVGETEHDDVRLAVHLDQLLAMEVLEGSLVDRLRLAGIDPGHAVGRLDPAEDLSSDPRRGHLVGLPGGHHQGLVGRGPLPLALVQEA